jgi:hypothetical protein
MKFIEMTGKTLQVVLTDDQLQVDRLHGAGVDDDTILRINQQGDIEVRRPGGWEIVGGLLGDFDRRVRRATGLDWA